MKPSSWISSDPAVTESLTLHTHPLTGGVRIVLVVYGLALAILLGALFWLILSGQHKDAHDRKLIRQEVAQEIDAAAKAGVARDVANNEKTRRSVCTVIKESLEPTKNTRALAHQLGCDVPSRQASPTPTVYIVRPAPTPSPPQRQPTSPPTTSPRPSHRPTTGPSPRPSPSKSCLLPAPLPCTAVGGI